MPTHTPDELTSTTTSASCPWYQPLCRVTPVSKYLAMIIFIMLPFVGGYVGYQYALTTVKPAVMSESVLGELVNAPEESQDFNNNYDSDSLQKPWITDQVNHEFRLEDGNVVFSTRGDAARVTTHIVESLDPKTFQSLNEISGQFELLYAKDDNNVVVSDGGVVLEIPGADVATFEVLGSVFSRDAKYVYMTFDVFGGVNYEPRVEKVNKADSLTFQVLKSGYAKDKNQVYFIANGNSIEIVKMADPETFFVTDVPSDRAPYDESYKAKDAYNTFDWGEIETVQ